MSNCDHGLQFSSVPPSLDSLVANYPSIATNKGLDRSLLRCRLCDLIATQRHAEATEYILPSNKNLLGEVEKRLRLIQELIDQNIEKEELKGTLPLNFKERDDAIAVMDKRIESAWREHWAIWGLSDGPEHLETLNEDKSWEENGNGKVSERSPNENCAKGNEQASAIPANDISKEGTQNQGLDFKSQR